MNTAIPPVSPDDGTASLAARFEQVSNLRPGAIALTLQDTSMTYGELNDRAGSLAAALRKRGVGAGALVAIHLDRSFELVVAIIATLKAGGAYLPLDLACPEERLRFQVRDAGAPVVLTHSDLAGRFAEGGPEVICLDREPGLFVSPGGVEPGAAAPGGLAYVIYTSGSTGQPKGVLVTQHNVLRLFSVTEPLFDFGPEDVWTLFHSSAFDFSVWEIFGALLYGGRLVIVPHAVSRSASDFQALLVREKVTVLNQTPAAFRQLVHADGAANEHPDSLRYVIFGGEALDFQSLRPWIERHGDAHPQLINMYGITETTVHVTHHRVAREQLDQAGSNIGRPLGDLIVYLVGENGGRVAPGEVGEMWVGGQGVARGYLNRPNLTVQRFVPNPFEEVDTAPVLYRSGDLARERPDGGLDYLGRCDHQVKIRGFRIELSEIESVLARHSAVRECAVLARAEAGVEPRLVGYVIPRAGEPPSVETLRAHLGQALPDYMVPAAFVHLESFPLTINGKLDRAALPAPGADRAHLAATYAAPQTEMETKLARLWKSTLQRDLVGTDDNFFDIGGDSLLLTALHRDLERELARAVPITDLFQYPTVRHLAAHLSSRNGSGGAEDRIQARARRQRAALEKGQA